MFRTFLLAAFKHFILNEIRNASTQRRGGLVATLSLSEGDLRERYDREPSTGETPDVIFDRTWCEELLRHTRTRLAEEYGKADKSKLFELLEPHLANSTSAMPRADICHTLKLSSAALAMSIHRMRKHFGELLREEITETLDDNGDVNDELTTLTGLLDSSRR